MNNLKESNEQINELHTDQYACSCEDFSGNTGEDYHGFDRLLIARLAVAVIIFILGLVIELSDTYVLLFMAASALVAGFDVLVGAVVNLFNKRVFDETLLMTIAAVAAFLIGESHEGAAVIILFQIGELFQDYAIGRTKRSVEELMDLRPDSATVLADGEERNIPAEEVEVGMFIVIRPGERVPLDCNVIEGNSVLDMSALTGESMPRPVGPGETLLSGSVNLSAPIKAQVTSIASESTAARILKMVQAESAKKGRTEKFITRFARIYTPVVIAIAVVLALVMWIVFKHPIIESVNRALVFLVISCPCALVISVPLTYFAGIGGASKLGILFKSSAAVDAVAKTRVVVFDKTGTLTTGSFKVSSVKPEKMDSDMMLKIAAHAEAYSNHPIAKSIVSAYGGPISYDLIDSHTEHSGKGIIAYIENIKIVLGSLEFLREQGTEVPDSKPDDMVVHMSIGDIYAGWIALSDTIKEDSAAAIRDLADAGVEHVSMLTGDSAEIASKLAKAVGIKEYFAECLPEDKVERVHELKKRTGDKGALIFVGDGINDAPVLTAADVGIAMGGLGSDAAVEAAEVVIMDDGPTKVAAAIHASKNILRIVYQNVVFALGAKLIIMALGVVGISTLWFAVFADVGIALATVLNSIRAFHIKRPNK